MADDATTIRISKATKERLMDYGKMGDSFEDVLVRILNRLDELEQDQTSSRRS